MFLATTVLRKTRCSPWQLGSGATQTWPQATQHPISKGSCGSCQLGPLTAEGVWAQEEGAKGEFSILPGKVLSPTRNGNELSLLTCALNTGWVKPGSHHTPETRVCHANLWWVASTPKVAASTIASATRHLTQRPSDSKCSQPAVEQTPLPASSACPPDV